MLNRWSPERNERRSLTLIQRQLLANCVPSSIVVRKLSYLDTDPQVLTA